MSLTLELGRQRWERYCKFEVSLVYILNVRLAGGGDNKSHLKHMSHKTQTKAYINADLGHALGGQSRASSFEMKQRTKDS